MDKTSTMKRRPAVPGDLSSVNPFPEPATVCQATGDNGCRPAANIPAVSPQGYKSTRLQDPPAKSETRDSNIMEISALVSPQPVRLGSANKRTKYFHHGLPGPSHMHLNGSARETPWKKPETKNIRVKPKPLMPGGPQAEREDLKALREYQRQLFLLEGTTKSGRPQPVPGIEYQRTSQTPVLRIPLPGSTTKTQKELMLAGDPYYAWDEQLIRDRDECEDACKRFNDTMAHMRAELFPLILQAPSSHQWPSRLGSNVAVRAPFFCDYGYNISIGNDVVIGRNCTISDSAQVTIGDDCSLGENVSILTILPPDPQWRQGPKSLLKALAVRIEDKCWIGEGAVIYPGLTLGCGSTVLPGAVVMQNVLPFTRVMGNPARVIQ